MHTRPASPTLIVWILGALATITPFAIDLYLPSFAQIASDFHTTPAKISLSVSSYFIGMALGQMIYGPLLDRYGRKKPLYLGLVIFVFACVGCMLSTDTGMLISFRFVQALGGSVAWVAALAMVRDFFPVEESARVFSLLFLVIGVSPLLAPTIGGFITEALGWQAIFIALILIVMAIAAIVYRFLPEAHQGDASISLRAGPMLNTFLSVLKDPQFATFAFAGAFSFSTLFIYVAGSPMIFMELFEVSPRVYGGIFALLSVGFIGGSQVNIFLVKKFSSNSIFRIALVVQVIGTLIFLAMAYGELVNLYSATAMFFVCLTCIGLINPNASALALAPFTRNVGSASALLACIQIGIAALASGGIGAFNSRSMFPVLMLMSITCLMAALIYFVGIRKQRSTLVTGTASPENVIH